MIGKRSVHKRKIKKTIDELCKDLVEYSKSQVKTWIIIKNYVLRAVGPVVPRDKSEYYFAHETGRFQLIRSTIYVDLDTGNLVDHFGSDLKFPELCLVANDLELLNARKTLATIRLRVRQIEGSKK